MALDEDENVNKKQPLFNNKIKTHTDTVHGKLMFCIVKEFLEFYNLDCTAAVFDAESYSGTCYKYEGRERIIDDLAILEIDEDSSLPILLQLINLLKVRDVNDKTDVSNYSSHNETVDSKGSSITEKVDTASILAPPKTAAFNETFVVSSPKNDIFENITIKVSEVNGCDSVPCSNTESESDAGLKDLDNSIKSSGESPKNLIDQSIEELELPPPVVKETKLCSKADISVDKLKLSPQKTEKFKPKGTLSPLQMNKARANDSLILPSLYNKEFKEKTSLKEVDKLLDMDLDGLDSYEEDFMSGSEMELSMHRGTLLKTNGSKVNLLEVSVSEKDETEMKVEENTRHDFEKFNVSTNNDSIVSSVTSEDFDDISNSTAS